MERVGQLDVFLWLHDTRPPTDEEWNAACDRVAELRQQRHGDVSSFRAIAVSDGGGPTTRHRARLFGDVYSGLTVKVSAFSDMLQNPLWRGMVTAVMWLNPGLRAFKPDAWRDGFEHVDLLEHTSEVMHGFEQAQRQLPLVASLTSLTAAVAQGSAGSSVE